MDAVGSAIRVDVRDREVMRILPRLNEAVNEEWISDKSRFIWDGFAGRSVSTGRTCGATGRLEAASWADAFAAIAGKVKGTKPERIGAIAGDLATVEEMFALRELMAALGVKNVDGRGAGERHDPALGPRQLHLQSQHRRHRSRRRDPDRRLRSAPRGGGAERAHP